jgi:hypothetical protein
MARPNREGGAAPSPNLADAFIMAFSSGGRRMQIHPDALRAA